MSMLLSENLRFTDSAPRRLLFSGATVVVAVVVVVTVVTVCSGVAERIAHVVIVCNPRS